MATSTATCKANESVIQGFYKMIGMQWQSTRTYPLQLLQMDQQLYVVDAKVPPTAGSLEKVTTAVVSQEMALKPL